MRTWVGWTLFLGVVTQVVALGTPSRAGEPSRVPSRASGDSWNIALQSRWAYGSCTAVAAMGDTVVTASGAVLQVIDFSNPQTPQMLSELELPGLVLDLDVSDHRAYVANRLDGLRIIDLSDPVNPVEVGSWPTEDHCTCVQVAGSLAYVGDWLQGVHILAVDDPANPIALGMASIEGSVSDLCVQEQYLYVCDSQSGLQIFDVSVPTEPVETAHLPVGNYSFGVDVDGVVAVLTRSSQVLTIDVADPAAPAVLGVHPAYGRYPVIDGDLVHVAAASSGYYALDISDPSQPEVIATLSTDGALQKLAMAGQRLYVAAYSAGVLAVDVGDVYDPVLLGSLDGPSSSWGIGVHDELVFLSVGGDGVHVFDITDPTAPSLEATIDAGLTGDTSCELSRIDDYLYLVALHDGLRVVDISDLAAPVLTEVLDLGGYCSDMVWVEQVGYVAVYTGARTGVAAIDLADPAHPVEVAFHPLDGLPYSLSIQDDLLYVGCITGHSVHVLDVSIPSAPTEIGSVVLDATSVYGVAASGESLVATTQSEGLFVISIVDPAQPSVTGHYDPPEGSRCVEVVASGDRAYLAAGDSGLLTVDISDPADPVLAGYYDTADQVERIAVRGADVFVTDFRAGWLALRDETHPSEIEHDRDRSDLGLRIQPSVSGQRFEIQCPPVQGEVELSVFDAQGRRVRQLLSQSGLNAPARILWDGRDDRAHRLAAGCYFVRMTTADHAASRSIRIVR